MTYTGRKVSVNWQKFMVDKTLGLGAYDRWASALDYEIDAYVKTDVQAEPSRMQWEILEVDGLPRLYRRDPVLGTPVTHGRNISVAFAEAIFDVRAATHAAMLARAARFAAIDEALGSAEVPA